MLIIECHSVVQTLVKQGGPGRREMSWGKGRREESGDASNIY